MIKSLLQRLHSFHLATSWLWLLVMMGLCTYNFNALVFQHRIQFDLMALLPEGNSSRDNQNLKAVNHLMADSKLTSQVIIMVGHENQTTAERALTELRQKIVSASLPIQEQSALTIGESYKTLFKTLHGHRQGFLSQHDRNLLLQGKSKILTQRALSEIMSPFSTSGPVQLKDDPFFLFPNFAKAIQPDNPFQMDEKGNLFVQTNGKTWYLFKAHLTQAAFSLTVQEEIAKKLTPILHTLEQDKGIQTLKLGAVFYAEAGAKQAQGEISSIGVLSFVGIILMLLVTFRTLRPLAFATMVIVTGIVGGLSACLIIFGSIHILAFVFGCSLVGITVDYALHYFCASYTNHNGERFSVLKSLMPALPLGVLSSCLGYGLLMFVPFPGIQQMATLACVGLLSAFLSVCIWGPYFIHKKSPKIPTFALKIQESLDKLSNLSHIRHLKSVLILIAVTIFILGLCQLTVDDDIRSLQSPNAALKAQEETIKSLMKWDASTKFLAITAPSFEDILQTQEIIMEELDTLKDKELLLSYQSLATLIPSVKRQQENNNLVKQELLTKEIQVLSKALGMGSLPKDKSIFTPFILTQERVTIIPEGWRELIHLPEGTIDFLQPPSLITGRIFLKGTSQDSAIVPLLLKLAETHSHGKIKVQYIDSLKEYESLFQSYRTTIILLILSILFGIILFISVKKNVSGAAQVITPVSLSLLTSVGLLGLCHIPINLFHTMGLLLVLCIGIDYGLFLFWRSPPLKDNPQEKTELLLLANGLAAVTTLLSFGLLALSETAAVRSFGIAVFLGITCSFILTTIFLGKPAFKKDPL